jgi:hypothetical protein
MRRPTSVLATESALGLLPSIALCSAQSVDKYMELRRQMKERACKTGNYTRRFWGLSPHGEWSEWISG